jgi:hypothetical protein
MKTALRTKMKLMGEPADVLQELKRTHHWLPAHLQPLNRCLMEHAEAYRRTQESRVRLVMEMDILRRLRPKLIPIRERQLLSEFISKTKEALDQSGKARQLTIQDSDIDAQLDERLYGDLRNWLRKQQEDRANLELLQYLDRLLCAWQIGRRQRMMFDL